MITISELKIPTGLSAQPEVIRRLLPELAEGVKNEIVVQAQRELGSTSQEYVGGLQLLHFPVSAMAMKRGPMRFASIVLTGMLPNMLENGWAGGDMKEFLLQGRTAKRGKDGSTYMTVPFRHQTPGTSGRAGTPMGGHESSKGMMSRTQAELLGKNVHKAAKKLEATTSHQEAGTKWGEKLSRAATARMGAPKGENKATGYKHKDSVYSGMVRKEKTYGKATQNQYMTFRRVSDNSDPGSWIHPGIVAHNFFEKAASKIPAMWKIACRGALYGANRGFIPPSGGM